jgi:hypothetical protein
VTARDDLDGTGKAATVALNGSPVDSNDELDESTATDPTANRLQRFCSFGRGLAPRHSFAIKECLFAPASMTTGEDG